MGMFDSVWVECPECGRHVEYQSKAGGCNLERYTLRDVPPEIAIDMDGDVENCKGCGYTMRLRCRAHIDCWVE